MTGVVANLAGNNLGVPSAPASASAAVVNTTTVNITYGVIKTNGSTLLPLQGSGTNSGDIYDATGTAVNLTYSGTLNPAGGTIQVTGSFAVNNNYTFYIRARNSAGVGPYTVTAAVQPSFSFAPFGFTPFSFTPFSFTPFGFTPFSFTPFGFTPFSFTPAPAFSFTPFAFNRFNFTGSCIHEDTLIKTLNGYVKAKELHINDKVASVELSEMPDNGPNGEVQYDYTTWESPSLTSTDGLTETTIVDIRQRVVDGTIYFNGDSTKLFSLAHPMFIYKNGKYEILPTALIEVGDCLVDVNEDGSFTNTLIETVDTVDGEQVVYQFDMEPHDWYISGDYLVHNK